MDLEELNKHQIVLLTLLVSFVTSIATGIVTVSLMNQAPPEISRIVNQIVEHTVERVVPATQGAAVVTEKTVVVKDDDLIASSIAAVQKSIVRIVAKGGNELLARGVIVEQKGGAFTDGAVLAASGADAFEAILWNGERVSVKVPAANASSTTLTFVSVAVGTSTGFAPSPLADPSKLKLGQGVIRIGGVGSDIVGTGVIAALPSKTFPNSLEASVSSATPGSVLISRFGEIIGVVTGDSQALGSDFYQIVHMPLIFATTTATNGVSHP